MTTFVDDEAHDASLNSQRTRATVVHLCTGDPADGPAAIAASLGSYTPTYSAVGAGTGGRRREFTVQQQTNVSISNPSSNPLNHYVGIDPGAGNNMVWKTASASNPTYADGAQVTINAFIIGTDPSVQG